MYVGSGVGYNILYSMYVCVYAVCTVHKGGLCLGVRVPLTNACGL